MGLTIAIGAASAGHKVVGFDVNEALVSQLNSGNSHIEGISNSKLQEYLLRVLLQQVLIQLCLRVLK